MNPTQDKHVGTHSNVKEQYTLVSNNYLCPLDSIFQQT